MVEAKLRVVQTEVRSGSENVCYGVTTDKKVVEHILYHDTDKREDIAPCGVYATIAINSEAVLGGTPLKTMRVFDIKVNRHYLDCESARDRTYLAIFNIEERTYDLFVKFTDDNRIETIMLSEWLDNGSYEKCFNSDNCYHKEDFTTIEELIS